MTLLPPPNSPSHVLTYTTTHLGCTMLRRLVACPNFYLPTNKTNAKSNLFICLYIVEYSLFPPRFSLPPPVITQTTPMYPVVPLCRNLYLLPHFIHAATESTDKTSCSFRNSADHRTPALQFQYAGQHSPIPDHYYNNPPYSQPPSLAHHHHHQLHLQDSDFPPHMAYWATGGGGGSGGGASPHHHSSHYPSAAAAVGYSSRRGSSSVMGGYSSNGYGGAYCE